MSNNGNKSIVGFAEAVRHKNKIISKEGERSSKDSKNDRSIGEQLHHRTIPLIIFRLIGIYPIILRVFQNTSI